MVIMIIEEARAVENIDEIAATPGIDVMFIGTSDLSFSLGLRGNQEHPRPAGGHRESGAQPARSTASFWDVPRRLRSVQKYLAQGFSFLPGAHRPGIHGRGRPRYLEPLGRTAARVKPKTIY